jgi:hypothetical protein
MSGEIAMVKILLLPAVALSSLGLTLPFGGDHLSRTGLERAISSQMNGSPAGQITRTVHCERAAGSGSTQYLCTLTGVHGTHERAVVVVSGSSWRADWAPISG